MPDFLRFFSDERFMPHGHCYLWEKPVLWLHILSDAGIALAYFAIPAVLLYFIRERKDVPYPWMFVLFGAFILACGTTHLFSIYTIWHPEYALEGVIKASTALVSLATAGLLIPLVPRALALKSPAALELRVNERTAELEQLNEALRSSEERGRLAIEAAPNGMIMVDNGGNIVLLNSEIEKMFGYERSELMGQKIGKLIPERFHEKHPEYREAYFQAPKTRAMGAGRDLYGRRKDGTEFPVEIGLNPLIIDEGTFVLAAIVDITGRKTAEAELREARDAAESASLAKGDFLTNMSHEIRTPLNGVFGMLGLLLDSGLNKTQLEYAETARISAEALLRLINDILDFSKIEAGQLDIEPVAFDLRRTVEDTADMLAVHAEEHGIELLVHYDPETPRNIVGDPGRIGQVLTNLVSNAIKFTVQGHVRIEVEAREQSKREADAPVEFRFTVSDTGIGIEEQRLEEVFEKFVQQDSSTTRKFGGAGLGLAISKELVELMGGEIGVLSRKGEGSSFWFTLKLPQQESPMRQSQSQSASRRAIPASQAGSSPRARILVAEDNAVNQLVAVRMLEALGCQVDVAADGIEVIQMLDAAPYDLVFMDCQMPEMDGYRATQEIRRRQGSTTGIPIVAMTAHAMAGEREKCLNAGMDDYLSKPVLLENFEQMLERHLPFDDSPNGAIREAALSGSTADLAHFDEAMLRDLRSLAANDEDFIRQLLERFRTQFDSRISELHSAVDAQQFDTVVEIAHALKGACSNLGAVRMVALFQALREQSEARSRQGVKNLLKMITLEYELVSGTFFGAVLKE